MDVDAEVSSPPQCSICIGNVTEGCETPCSHIYHTDCLLQWLQTHPLNPTCPNCMGTCFPAMVDTTYSYVEFVGVVNQVAEGQGGAAQNDVMEDEWVMDIPEQADEVQWVMDNPAEGGEVQWVMDIPAEEVQWVMDIPAEEVQWVMDIPANDDSQM